MYKRSLTQEKCEKLVANNGKKFVTLKEGSELLSIGLHAFRDLAADEGVLHNEEGVDFIPANIELSALEVALVNVMSREVILKSLVDSLRDRYETIIIDCIPFVSCVFNVGSSWRPRKSIISYR